MRFLSEPLYFNENEEPLLLIAHGYPSITIKISGQINRFLYANAILCINARSAFLIKILLFIILSLKTG